MHPFGEYAAKTLGYKKIVTIGLDYAFGWETVGGFHKSFEDNGGQIIQKMWVPLNVQDYGPYLGQIRKDADAVFVNGLGRWTLLFAKQYSESGLRGKLPLLANGTYSDEHVLPQLGDESLGVISAHHYSAALETPANQKFRAAYEKAYGRLPGFYGENCYTGARILAEAVKAVGGKVEDRAALMVMAKALSSAYLPISATAISEGIYQSLVSGSDKVGVFAHGYTYSGHPVPCAVALETLDVMRARP